MANQLNYGNKIATFTDERMFRLFPEDQDAIEIGEKFNLFGISQKNNAEFWFYNPDGSYAGHITLNVNDEDLGLVTAPDDNTVQYEYVIFNLEKIIERVALVPGRYSVAIGLYKDEVSSEKSNKKLVIREISNNRKEVRLELEKPSDFDEPVDDERAIAELQEFARPSVPPLYAKLLVDQIFAQSEGGLEEGEYIEVGTLDTWKDASLTKAITETNPAFANRLSRVEKVAPGTTETYIVTANEVLWRTYNRTVDLLASDYKNMRIQKEELLKYAEEALDKTLIEMELKQQLDPRFNFVKS